MKEKIERIQTVLAKHNLDAWVVFSHHSYDIHTKYLLEKWVSSPTLVLVPVEGTPKVHTSAMEAMMINSDVYDVLPYKTRTEMMEAFNMQFQEIEKGSIVAMNFVSPSDILTDMGKDILAKGTCEALQALNPNLEYVSAKDVIYDIRSIKTKKEQEYHKIASKQTEELMIETIEPIIKPGMTEKELASLIEFECNKLGGVAFNAIVASGSNSAVPHHESRSKKLTTNEVLLIDYGSKHNWANADITRTYWIGSNPPESVVRAYEAVDKAKEAAYKVMKAGVDASLADQAVRDTFNEFGYDSEKYFLHSTGHPLGIETHDIGVGIARRSDTLAPVQYLLEDSVVTVEPGLYFQGEFGIRLEDDVIVTKEGIIRLCNTPKDLLCL